MNKAGFYNNCVGWDRSDVYCYGGLIHLIDNMKDITRETFMSNVNSEDRKLIEKELGYSKDFKISKDWHVTYHSSRHHGERVYIMRHSAIEYVFKE